MTRIVGMQPIEAEVALGGGVVVAARPVEGYVYVSVGHLIST